MAKSPTPTKRSIRPRKGISAFLCLVYLSAIPARSLWTQGFKEVIPGDAVEVPDLSVGRFPAVALPLDGGVSGDSLSPISLDQEIPAETPLVSGSIKTFPPNTSPLVTTHVASSRPSAASEASRVVQRHLEATRHEQSPISNDQSAGRSESSGLSQILAIHAAIARAEAADSIEAARQQSDFVDFYSAFLKEIDAQFASPQYKSDRTLFLRDVEQSRFHSARTGIGELEAKLIDGHVCVRFASLKGTKPLIAVVSNIPLAINAGLLPLQIQPLNSWRSHGVQVDPQLGSKKLDTYRSRLLINRKVHFSRLLTEGSMGDPHRAVLIIGHLSGEVLISPALKKLNGRWLKHWVKGTIEPFHYGDLFRGVLSSSIQFGLACLMAAIVARVNPNADSFTWGPAIAVGVFSLTLATMSDSYYTFVQRGDNRIWETIKRLGIGAALSYPISIMQAHGDWMTIFTLKTNLVVWLVSFGDRYLSTVTSVVPKIHQKYFMKPWFFPVRMKVPLRDFAAKLTGDANLKNSTTKGVLMTREALAIPRFVIRFLGLFLDPMTMAYTHGVPTATLFLWILVLPTEIFNYYAIKKLAMKNPIIKEEFNAMKARQERWIGLLRRNKKKS
jgi:hypothetical protein